MTHLGEIAVAGDCNFRNISFTVATIKRHATVHLRDVQYSEQNPHLYSTYYKVAEPPPLGKMYQYIVHFFSNCWPKQPRAKSNSMMTPTACLNDHDEDGTQCPSTTVVPTLPRGRAHQRISHLMSY